MLFLFIISAMNKWCTFWDWSRYICIFNSWLFGKGNMRNLGALPLLWENLIGLLSVLSLHYVRHVLLRLMNLLYWAVLRLTNWRYLVVKGEFIRLLENSRLVYILVHVAMSRLLVVVNRLLLIFGFLIDERRLFKCRNWRSCFIFFLDISGVVITFE